MLTRTVRRAILSVQSQSVTLQNSRKEVIEMDSEQIAKKLIELRHEKPRAKVASDLGISVSALTMYETGARIPRDETKKRIATYYGKSVQEIFFV